MASAASRPPGTGLTIGLLWISVAGIIAYWATYFSNVATAPWDRCYVVFENAFPPADAMLALSAVVAAELLRRRRGASIPWGLLAAGQFCFLGLLGAAYNLQHGGYSLTPAMLAELWVNTFCLGMAAWLSVFLWRHRQALGA